MSQARKARRARHREEAEINKVVGWIPRAFEAALFNTAEDPAFEYKAMFERFNAAW